MKNPKTKDESMNVCLVYLHGLFIVVFNNEVKSKCKMIAIIITIICSYLKKVTMNLFTKLRNIADVF